MSALARLEAFESVAILPPAFDLAAALSVVSSAEGLARAIADLETQVATWRAKSTADFRDEEVRVRAIAAKASPEDIVAQLLPRLRFLRASVAEAIVAVPEPPSKMHAIDASMASIRRTSPDLARYLRKLIKRSDTARMDVLETLSAIQDRLLVIELDFDPEARAAPDGPTFTEADDLIAYLDS